MKHDDNKNKLLCSVLHSAVYSIPFGIEPHLNLLLWSLISHETPHHIIQKVVVFREKPFSILAEESEFLWLALINWCVFRELRLEPKVD